VSHWKSFNLHSFSILSAAPIRLKVVYPGGPGVSNFPFRHSPSLGWWKVFKGYFPVGFASRFCGEIRWTPATLEGYLPGVAG
jgi:hypothetical protein